jgi:hypothetical protein
MIIAWSSRLVVGHEAENLILNNNINKPKREAKDKIEGM